MITIRTMQKTDSETVLKMMRTFYASPAVLSNGSEEIFRNDLAACLNGSPYLEGYVFSENDKIFGYAMLAKSFSTEFGKPCIWIEDLYLEESCRGMGLGTRFLKFVESRFPNCLLRLEAEAENENAVHVYRKCGFEILPYLELKKG